MTKFTIPTIVLVLLLLQNAFFPAYLIITACLVAAMEADISQKQEGKHSGQYVQQDPVSCCHSLTTVIATNPYQVDHKSQ